MRAFLSNDVKIIESVYKLKNLLIEIILYK